jgi:hypothetical protein
MNSDISVIHILTEIKLRPLTTDDLDKDDQLDKKIINIPKFQENYGHTKRIKP